ncbi:YjiH family protein [Marinobacterium rhizophilum]|uniref:YjiH family protein n=1 Tax=Marinobacterium rhizophilum TaxID=420402 RepID=A0ABY5HJE4_9GAMM|nr:YjiH family protein [Marinobacterium rhizophilum]UTW12234.1 YjiH family protein [Marinobacterium rhizophilum]
MTFRHTTEPQIAAEDTNLINPAEKEVKSFSMMRKLKFIIPSLLGVMLFMMPFEHEGRLTVPIARLIDIINSFIAPYMLAVSVIVAVVPSLLTLIVSLIRPLREMDNNVVQLFNPGFIWTALRVAGAITMLLVYFKAGPEWVWSQNTGGVLLYEVAPVLLALYFVSALLLPLLTEYGLMEFVGTLVSKVFTRAFRLPGGAAIDSMASWLSATSLGVMLTTQQYRSGHYTEREAASIITSFSVVSVGFSYVVLKFIKMEHVFVPWYLSVAIAGIVCALIVPRLPPLRNLPEKYATGATRQPQTDDRGEHEGLVKWAFRRAIERADRSEPLAKQLSGGIHAATDLAITVYPAMMIVGVLGLSLIEYTGVMQVIATPLVPILELLQLPEAQAAATAIMTGFIDLLMPVILGASIESELTRFVVAGVTVNGIIFLSEVALIMMRARIGLNLWRLFSIWILRLLISLPVFTLMGNLVL